MKFGKSLSNQIEETLPEWRDKFLSYKDLKKRLKLIDPPPTSASSSSPSIAAAAGRPPPHKRPRPAPTTTGHDQAMTAEEEGFVTLLEAELDKFNTFFVEKEEEYIIRQKELQDRLRTSKDSRKEMMKVRKEIVDFHGEMVLLENYSALNYTGLVKILKKYDKRTGALLRLPFIQRVLQQPFFTTDVLDQLIKQCETMHDGLLPDPSSLLQHQQQQPGGAAATTTTEEGPPRRIPELEEIEYMESLYMKSTLAALRALREIRSRSSTVSVFSLPPLQTSGAIDTRWPTINISPVLQQAAD